MKLFPAKSLNFTKRTIKGTEERKFQPQYIYFGLGIRSLPRKTQQRQDNLLLYQYIRAAKSA